MKDTEITILFRNNLIKARRLGLGLSQADLAKKLKMATPTLSAYERFRYNPLCNSKKTGLIWKQSALKLAKFFAVKPYDLFPEHFQLIKQSRYVTEIDSYVYLEHMYGDIPLLQDERYSKKELGNIITKVLSTLTPREEKVLRMRFGLDKDDQEYTLQQVAEDFRVSRQRIKQIEAKALRKLRHAGRVKPLKDFIDY